MEAWQKGGMFEGEKATDDRVLKFWKDKAAGVSKDDPLYDTYKNAYTQLDYTISESKMTAWYATSPKGDAQNRRMVNFYLGWAKKVPKDSEFYRVLKRDAGQYMRVQRAASAGNARQAKEEAYQRQQAGTQKTKEAAGEFVIETLRRIAQSGNVTLGIAPAIAAPGSGSDLTDFDPSDPDRMLRLISAIAPEKKGLLTPSGYIAGTGEFKGSDAVLYYDDDGKAVTGTDVLKQLGGLDPQFRPGAPFDTNYITGLLDRQMQGLNERIQRAKDNGRMSDVVSLQKSKGYVALLNREVAAYPVQRAYQEARADYDAVVADKSSSPQAVLNAWQEYSATLTKLANDPRIEADDNTRSRLIAEVNGQDGVPTLAESFTGLANGQFDPSTAKDAAQNREGIEFMRQQVEAVESGSAVWTYGEKDSNGIFVPKAGGREIGAATLQAVQAGGINPQVVTVPDPRGGAPLQIAVTAVPIYAAAKDPVTGEPLPGTNSQPIGYAYDLPKGNGTQTQYSFTTKDGPIFTSDPLWGDDNKVISSSKGGNHLEVDFSDEVAKSLGYGDKDPVTGAYRVVPANLNTDISLPNGINVRQNGANADGTLKPPTIAFDPQTLAWASGTRGALGAPDPITDFKSLTLSTLMADEDGLSILSNLDKNPQFKQTMEDDAYRYAGAQRDPKTGAWLPGTGDQMKLNNALGQQNIASTAKSFVAFIGEAATMFQRITTGSPAGKSDLTGPLPELQKLATDLVQGTPFESLGKAFMPGTSTIKPVTKDDLANGFAIKPVTTIKAPMLPDVKVQQNIFGTTPTSTSPTPVTGPTQTGSTAPGGTSSQTGSQPPKPPKPQPGGGSGIGYR